jgi:hypothetical protein
MIAEEEAGLTRQSDLSEETGGEVPLTLEGGETSAVHLDREYYPDK